ncbi:MAG: tRNA (adenosine(37)-N6)-threonylcarbamoyltransferase complex dimerization subunit type 1 TsaB [Caldilineaceae bacterium]
MRHHPGCAGGAADAMLLAIDTATVTASLALFDAAPPPAGHLLAELTWNAHRRHTQDLVAAIDALVSRAGVSMAQVTALAVTTGPGSFTGVRVGISTVKGMVEGLRLARLAAIAVDERPADQPVRVVGVPTLTVTAAPWLDLAYSVSPAPVVCALIQAGRGRYNWCFFGPEDLLYRPPAEAHGAGAAADLAAILADHGAAAIWLAGETDDALAEAVRPVKRVTVLDPVLAQRRAGVLARVAALLLAEGVDESAELLAPLYLRPPA